MKDNFLVPDFKNQNKLEKILTICSYILSLIILISIIVSIFTHNNLYYIYETSLCFMLIIQGILYYKYNKPLAITDFICSIFILLIEIISLVR